MKNTVLLLPLFFYSSTAISQYLSRIRGTVTDTSSHTRLTNATIALLHSKDSTLRSFTWNTPGGSFMMDRLPAGEYILLVSYPGYADYTERFALDSSAGERDFGQINMILRSKLLEEVIVRSRKAPVKINGDTTEYNASSFNIKPNDRVEDLLKQLPGIEVDRDGNIKAQGEQVNTVLVDGEEFFGDDPTLVTKNIRSDMVDKVQVYDKKSDQAAFTGIDDGEKNKTINIKLKEDKKKGYFGKAEAGGGSDGFYQNQAMINIFKPKRRVSAYGNKANTGRVGMGWDENSKYGTSSNDVQVNEDGDIFITGNSFDEMEPFNGKYSGEGIPSSTSAGLHYDGKFRDDKASVNANYKTAAMEVNGTKNSISQNNLPGRVIVTLSDEAFRRYSSQHLMNGTYQLRADSASQLKIYMAGKTKNSDNTSSFRSLSRQGNGQLLNSNDRINSGKGDELSFNGNIFYSRKLGRPGRTVSATLEGSDVETSSDGMLQSSIDYFNPLTGAADSTRQISQFKLYEGKKSDFKANLVYTEPLSKTLSLSVSYMSGFSYGVSDRKSFNLSATGKYDLLDSTLSNDFEFRQLMNQGGATFTYKKGKVLWNAGASLLGTQFRQNDLFNNTSIRRNFVNITPQAKYQYKFSQQRSLKINYSGYTTQPRIDEIQPVRVNTDPLNIRLGNAELTPSFTNNINAFYNNYKVLTESYFYLYGNYSLTSNPIVNNTSTDSAGKSVYQSFNLGSKMPFSFSLSGSFSKKIKKGDWSASLSGTMFGNTSYSLVNDVLNRTRSYNFSTDLNLRTYQKKFTFNISAGPTYNIGESSLQRQFNTNAFGIDVSSEVSVQLPWGMRITSDADYKYQARSRSFNTPFTRLLWNASLNKTFLEEENLILSLHANDLLRQNIGFSRTAFSGMLMQTSYSNINRYLLLTLTWEFNKMGGSGTKK